VTVSPLSLPSVARRRSHPHDRTGPRWSPSERAVDAGVALALAILSMPGVIIGHGAARPLAFALSLGLTLPLIWRRRAPLAVFAIVAGVAFAQWTIGELLFADVGLLIAFYTVAARETARRTLLAAAALEVGVLLAVLRWSGRHTALVEFVLLSGMVTAAGVIGTNGRVRRAYLAEVEQRAARLERERDQQAQLAAAAERARIARDVHDIVAHNLAVMVALADGAALTVASDPARAADAMTQTATTGRTALREMRRVLGVLRAEADEAARRPPPALADLDALLVQVRRTGLQVSLTTEGRPAALPSDLQLGIYRLVQEALTNTLKHATAPHQAWVRLSCQRDHVEVEVTDDGRAEPSRPRTSAVAGHGLAGMRERAATFGGTVDAGRIATGGWRVHARLSTRAVAAPAAGRPGLSLSAAR
jgi:signal transduction histidine kinase